ncbi:MAG: hypothetical protein PHS44_03565 [Candidatus Dojkabacteria bacterium]|nr:hypothetical protein [Candidatus Dojkabacteria bacterium]
MKKTKPKTPICPRCFSKIREEDDRCKKCGFLLSSDSEILYKENLKN